MMEKILHAAVLLTLSLSVAFSLSGCYRLQPSSGGGQTDFDPPRTVNPEDVALPEGYQIEVVAVGLTFPTGVAFDEAGRAYVTEAGYSYGEVFATPRLLRIDGLREATTIATGDNGPWNGVVYHEGAPGSEAGAGFYVAEGGQLEGGRILRITEAGGVTPIVEGLPSLGDHHTNGPAVGPEGWIYFGQGTATNSAVVGPDNAQFGWLYRYPDFHDIPCRDVTLTGRNYVSENPLTEDPDDRVTTGAYVPFGTPTEEGQVIEGALPCGGAVMRVRPDGAGLELIAWGFRNPYGLAFAPGGQLYVTENGYDVRGSRPAWGPGDYLWAVAPGLWYGWPDFAGGVPLQAFEPPGADPPAPVLAEHPRTPPEPVALLGVHSSSNGIDFSHADAFGFAGDAFIAQFGDMAPGVGKVLAPVGYRVVRVDVETGLVRGFAANDGPTNGPASKIGGGGFERPISVRFSPDGSALYVVDFGVMTVHDHPMPRPETGVLWRITREDQEDQP